MPYSSEAAYNTVIQPKLLEENVNTPTESSSPQQPAEERETLLGMKPKMCPPKEENRSGKAGRLACEEGPRASAAQPREGRAPT